MFSALSQGSLVHILEKTNGLKYKIGEVIGVTQPNNPVGIFGASSFNNSNNPITLKIKVDGDIREYPEIPSAGSTMSYNGGKVVLCETIQNLQTEIENIYKRNKQTIDNISVFEKEISDCEDIMKEISPQFAKDKERDERINDLDTKVTSIESKLDKILNAVSGNSSPTLKL